MNSKKTHFLTGKYQVIQKLESCFGTYATGVCAEDIREYLKQYEFQDMTTALKLLQNVDFFAAHRNIALAKELLDTIMAQNNNSLDGVFFCPMSENTGDSASSMIRLLKLSIGGNAKARKIIQDNFLNNIFELEHLVDDSNTKKIIFVDHFIGTGNSILRIWGGIRQWQNDNHSYYVGALVAYEDAMERIDDETNSILQIFSGLVLPSNTRIFHENNNTFSLNEQEIIKQYCAKIEKNKRNQYGYNNSQSLVIFHDRAPNNALPILHKKTDDWMPLFPRHFD